MKYENGTYIAKPGQRVADKNGRLATIQWRTVFGKLGILFDGDTFPAVVNMEQVVEVVTLRELKAGEKLPAPIYVSDPYVVIGREGCIVDSGTFQDMLALSDYYDDCVVDIRRYDLHLNDNIKLEG